MKIHLVVHHELDPNSGAAGSVLCLGEEFTRAGHDVTIYSWSDLPERMAPLQKQVLFPVFVARHLGYRGAERREDVVDASTGDTWLWSLVGRRPRETLLVTHSHGLEHVAHHARLVSADTGELKLSRRYPLYWGGIHLREVAITLRRADLALFLNQPDLEFAVARLGVARCKARVVSNGIPEVFLGLPFAPTPRTGAIAIAQIGRLSEEKGANYGVVALSEILLRYPSARVTFLGTGEPTETTLQRFEPELRHRVTAVSQYRNKELPVRLDGHQIKIFPTLSEGFGMVLLEAMACGLAPITTATPGPLEIVKQGENGIVVPPRDSDALVGAMVSLLEDRELLDRLRRAAHATAQGSSWRALAERRLELYEEFRKKLKQAA